VQVSDKYYGLYRAICMDNSDPDGSNRIKVTIPALVSGADSRGSSITTGWIPGCLPVVVDSDHGTNGGLSITSSGSSASNTGSGGTPPHTHTMAHTHTITLTPHVKVPELNQVVWVMFEQGDINFPVWMGVYL